MEISEKTMEVVRELNTLAAVHTEITDTAARLRQEYTNAISREGALQERLLPESLPENILEQALLLRELVEVWHETGKLRNEYSAVNQRIDALSRKIRVTRFALQTALSIELGCPSFTPTP